MKQEFKCKLCGKTFNDYVSRRSYMERFCSVNCSIIFKTGIKRPKEIGEKISKSKLGHEVTLETRKKVGDFFRGKTYEEIMGKEKAKERIVSQKIKNKGEGNPFYNKNHDQTTKKVMSVLKKGKTHEEIMGKEKAKKWNEKMSGENSPLWLGGYSIKDYKKFTNLLKSKIRKRDNQICMMCGKHREKMKTALSVHHIDYNKQNSIPKNCISLCMSCHPKTNYNRKHWKVFFQNIMKEKYNYNYETIIVEILNA